MDVKIPERPYLTQGEILRVLSVALGTKNNNPDVDQLARRGDFDCELRSKLLNDLFYLPLVEHGLESFAFFFTKSLDHILNEYVRLVNTVSLDAMDRKESMPVLIEHFFCRFFSGLLLRFHKDFGGPGPRSYLEDIDNNYLGVACRWLELNVDSFPVFLKSNDKKWQDQYRKWKKGQEIPKFESLLLFLSDFPESPDKQTILIHLIASRFIHFYGNKFTAYDLKAYVNQAIKNVGKYDVGRALSMANHNAAEKFAPLRQAIIPAFELLSLKSEKDSTIQQKAKKELDLFEVRIGQMDPSGRTRHFYEWLQARWLLFSGEYQKALKQYEVAFQYSIYRTSNVQEILKEALALAAKERDKALMKRLKNQAAAFGFYNLPEAIESTSNPKKKTKIDVVEDWEIEQWDMAFARLFPAKSCFPGCFDEKKHSVNLPFVHHVEKKHFEREPDLDNPNRRRDVGIKIGGNKRRYSELIWHTDNNHPEHVESLLDAGAKVDLLSDTSDSALLLAILEIVNSGDRRCYDLLKSQKHSQQTMNACTDKEKRTILLAALETGQPDIVSTVLDMGAEVDLRGKTDNTTALNQCLKYLGTLKSPLKTFLNQMSLSIDDPVFIDSVRRLSAGFLGLSDAEVRNRLHSQKYDPRMQEVLSALTEAFVENKVEKFEKDKLYEICNLLLDRGADPNAVHTSPIKGYTPLMLAVENDDAELVKKMLSLGGDPYKVYFHGPEPVDCWKIAQEFRANRSLDVLGRRKA
ncbi:hypothetical protein [Aliamphritea hakodatensis]|uniref:hypothetical protein n=1 Tax=Aliamphritea hakodatensis TaxID=2895352 RepID=UPI0022FD379B|nr:hypothetical protein [Aliamphritea hakodatensis]